MKFRAGRAHLHAKQALFVAIDAGGKKEGVYIRDQYLADGVGMSIGDPAAKSR